MAGDLQFGTFMIFGSGARSAFGDVVLSLAGVDEPVAVARALGVYPEGRSACSVQRHSDRRWSAYR